MQNMSTSPPSPNTMLEHTWRQGDGSAAFVTQTRREGDSHHGSTRLIQPHTNLCCRRRHYRKFSERSFLPGALLCGLQRPQQRRFHNTCKWAVLTGHHKIRACSLTHCAPYSFHCYHLGSAAFLYQPGSRTTKITRVNGTTDIATGFRGNRQTTKDGTNTERKYLQRRESMKDNTVLEEANIRPL
ncbi:unnamed protein product [Ectocarpus sp. 12 AP-2014]